MTAYETAVAQAVAALAGAVSGDTAGFRAAIMKCVRVRGGLVGDGRFVDKEILREVTIEVIDRFMAEIAAGLAPEADQISPELGEAVDEQLAKVRARLEAQFLSLLEPL